MTWFVVRKPSSKSGTPQFCPFESYHTENDRRHFLWFRNKLIGAIFYAFEISSVPYLIVRSLSHSSRDFFFFFSSNEQRARGGGGGGGEGALPDFFFFFPCSADHERDWPPCKVVFFGLATNALNARNNNNNNSDCMFWEKSGGGPTTQPVGTATMTTVTSATRVDLESFSSRCWTFRRTHTSADPIRVLCTRLALPLTLCLTSRLAPRARLTVDVPTRAVRLAGIFLRRKKRCAGVVGTRTNWVLKGEEGGMTTPLQYVARFDGGGEIFGFGGGGYKESWSWCSRFVEYPSLFVATSGEKPAFRLTTFS